MNIKDMRKDLIQASRGCPFKCIFCSVQRSWGGIQRRKSPKRLIDEIKWLIRRFGATSLSFCDDTFTLNRRWVDKVCNLMLKENVEIYWSALTRVDLVDKKRLSLMKKAGCILLFYGVESVSPSILKFIGSKSYSEDLVKRKIIETIASGIDTQVSVIFGWPIDTVETIMHTSRFCQEITRMGTSKIHCHLLFPLPGTRLVKEYSSFIVPNPYPKATQPDLAALPAEYYSLMERYRKYAPDFWMFRNQDLTPIETVKMFADAKLSIIGETYRRLLIQQGFKIDF